MLDQTKKSAWRGVVPSALALLTLGGMAAAGVVPRLEQRHALARTQARVDEPRAVRVGQVQTGPARAEITLPATSAPFFSTALYARSLGFLRRNRVEVGDRVRRGQLLAEIDAPETDEEVLLARAQLEEAAQNVHLVERNADRNQRLSDVGVVSKEAADQLRAQANSAAASLKTRRAALKRVSTLRGYQRVLAPFDGVITRRSFDPGALVGVGGQGGLPLFELAQTNTLRVFIDVPQSLAAGVVPGIDAVVYAPSSPADTVPGKVIRTAVVLDASTRTLRTEVNIPGNGRVLPGSFVYARLSVPRTAAPLQIPGAALVVRKEGTLVARVDGERVHIVPVQVGRDLGKEVELTAGVRAGDRVVLNPSDDLVDGMPVRVVERKPDAAH